MISFARKFFLSAILVGSTSFIQAQPAFFEVRSTPYDRQMSRVEMTFAPISSYPVGGPSLTLVNDWMIQLRAMPYRYSHEWRTPFEVEHAGAADCKGKALLLYDRMQLNGATNLRFVIGKRRASDSLTHAWLEWDTMFGTLLLDPTFNWAATFKSAEPQYYVAFYGFEGARKFQAASMLLAKRTFVGPSPASPAHGMIMRQTRTFSRTRPVPMIFDDARIEQRLFPLRQTL
ncbi:MAG TPA: hypothetical protein VH170_07485 [Chthoniobacterales bacterium]|jgi:hypothetical protein|nr:hypothetical protein [Chthoniobacterales bacterium]